MKTSEINILVKINKISQEINWVEKNCVFDIHSKSKNICAYKINKKLRDELRESEYNIESVILEKIHFFDFGLIINKNLKEKEIEIYTDPYGITPNYFLETDQEIIISNSIYKLSTFLHNLSFNIEAIADYLLFNYVIQGRTFLSGIQQIRGGQKLTIKEARFSEHNYLDWKLLKNMEPDPAQSIEYILADFIRDRSNGKVQTYVGLSGGFDSKTIVAACLFNKINFGTYTFGNSANSDVVAAKKTAEILDLNFTQLDLSQKNNSEYKEAFELFLERNENLAFPPTLMNYIFVNDLIESSQIFTGKMGSEIIMGPSLISGLIFTNCAKELFNTSDIISLKKKLISISTVRNLFKDDSGFDIYCSKLMEYTYQENKLNLLQFLLTETYAKFFGQVNNSMNKHSILNPFTDIRFLKLILKNKLWYGEQRKNPFEKMKARSHYFNWIKNLHPKTLDTPLDRGLKLKSYNKNILYIKPALNYIYRKLFISKSKKSTNLLFDFLVKESTLAECEWLPLNPSIQDFIKNKRTLYSGKKTLTNLEKLELIKLRVLEIQLAKYT